MKRIRVGIDVGGTFTDLVVYDEGEGRLYHVKSLTTPEDPVKGVLNAIRESIGSPSGIDILIHATTLGTNVFFGQKGLEPPKAVLITNKGFEDIIEIGRQNRPELYNPFFTRPSPLIPRSKRHGVKGRIDKDGRIVEDIDEVEIEEIARRECEEGVRVFVISFLHSYRNPTHELRAAEAVKRACPDAIVVTSYEVDPQPMEYERTSTTVINAILKPILSTYFERLIRELKSRGFKGKILIMQSNGGFASVDEALKRPVAFIESGPAAGVIAVSYLSKLMGVDKALSLDMGGTTSKASCIIKGEPELVELFEVGGDVHSGGRVRGKGYPVRVPHIDIVEVGIGGGTIAWIDPGGSLRVGPISAGSNPGPVCYGRGGKEPTVADADLALGRLPDVIADGIRLRKDLAIEAIRDKIARPLGLDVIEAAWHIVKIANAVIAKALRLVSIERGLDPREFTLYAFGGAGPLHAVEIAFELGIDKVVIPPCPGVFSALGLLLADYRHMFIRPIVKRSSEIHDDDLNAIFEDLVERAITTLNDEGVPDDRIIIKKTIEARYWGQAYTLSVPYKGDVVGTVEEFHRIHELRYGFSNPEDEVVFVTAKVEAIGIVDKPPIFKARPHSDLKPKDKREVYFDNGWEVAEVYDVNSLGVNSEVIGPAVIEGPDSTILIPPGYCGTVDMTGSIVVRRC